MLKKKTPYISFSPTESEEGVGGKLFCIGGGGEMEEEATSKFYRLTSPRSSSPKLYLQAAVRTETKLLKPLLQVAAVLLSLFVGWSRIADNKHFLTDVLARFEFGAIQFCMVCGESGPTFAVIKTDITALAQSKFAHALYTQIWTAWFWCNINTGL